MYPWPLLEILNLECARAQQSHQHAPAFLQTPFHLCSWYFHPASPLPSLRVVVVLLTMPLVSRSVPPAAGSARNLQNIAVTLYMIQCHALEQVHLQDLSDSAHSPSACSRTWSLYASISYHFLFGVGCNWLSCLFPKQGNPMAGRENKT